MMYTIIFYGSIFLSIALLTIALLRNSWNFLLPSIVSTLPFSLYLAGMPSFRWAITVPFVYVLIFYLVRRYTIKDAE